MNALIKREEAVYPVHRGSTQRVAKGISRIMMRNSQRDSWSGGPTQSETRGQSIPGARS